MRRRGLDVLRIVSILGVIAIHVFGGVVSNTGARGSGSWWLATVADIGFIWVVPVFVMVSGALVLDPRMYREGARAFYTKRLLRLGWAFVFWQAFYLIVVYAGLSHEPLTLGRTAALIYAGTTYTHLYFLWLIVGLYAVAPILFAFLRDAGRLRAGVTALVILLATTAAYVGASVLTHFGSPTSVSLMALTQWVPYVGYFVAGWALRDVRLRGWRLAGAAAATAVAIAGDIALYDEPGRLPLLAAFLPVDYLGPLVIVSAIGVFVVANSLIEPLRATELGARRLAVVSDSVFGVYLFHFFLLVLVTTLWPHLGVLRDDEWWAALPLWAGIALVSFGFSMAMRRVPFVKRLF